MDKYILKILSEKVKICADWAAIYNSGLETALNKIAEEISEVEE